MPPPVDLPPATFEEAVDVLEAAAAQSGVPFALPPHERNVAEGGLALSQEPRVEYVSLTRSTYELLFLKEVNNESEDDQMETVYFEL